jgi:hypothetical protein
VNLLTSVLSNPDRLADLDEASWGELWRRARQARMVGTIEHLAHGLTVPDTARDILDAARIYADHLQIVARRELEKLDYQTREINYPIVLLKGIAYTMSALPNNPGRRLSDIDILVEHRHLEALERHLLDRDWYYEESLSDYDHKYYRDWTHELPPLHHADHYMEVDIHHALIQPTGRTPVDTALLIPELAPVAGSRFYTLSPRDMVLHSALHLFMSDELRGGIRDLYDIHTLCGHFTQSDSNFWTALTARAEQLKLERPLYYALDSCRSLFDTPIPTAEWQSLERGGKPGTAVDTLMRHLIRREVTPAKPDEYPSSSWVGLALYIRSHWVRMPPVLLVRHLSYKWWLNRRAGNTSVLD